MENRLFDELHRKISELVAASPARDVEKNLRALLSSTFARLDLVTREEFDVQQEVLRRTSEKLQQLEMQLQALEAQMGIAKEPVENPGNDA